MDKVENWVVLNITFTLLPLIDLYGFIRSLKLLIPIVSCILQRNMNGLLNYEYIISETGVKIYTFLSTTAFGKKGKNYIHALCPNTSFLLSFHVF
jgi:hypothetical protein